MYLYSYCMTISFFFFFSQCFVEDAPKEKVFLWNIFLTSWFSQISSRGWIKFWLHSSSVWSMQKKIEYTFLSLSLSPSLSLCLSHSFFFLLHLYDPFFCHCLSMYFIFLFLMKSESYKYDVNLRIVNSNAIILTKHTSCYSVQTYYVRFTRNCSRSVLAKSTMDWSQFKSQDTPNRGPKSRLPAAVRYRLS